MTVHQRATAAGAALAALCAATVLSPAGASAADPAAPRTERVSVGPDGAQANAASTNPALSADGRYVAFVSAARDLVPGDTNGTPDAFVRDTVTGVTERVSVKSNGKASHGVVREVSLSSDGRYAVFTSTADDLVRGDPNDLDDVFLHDRSTGRTQRISPTGASYDGLRDHLTYDPVVSGDGRYVAYASGAEDLVEGDANTRDDVFLHDRKKKTTELVQLTDGDEQGEGDAFDPAFAGDTGGRYVAFTSNASGLAEVEDHSSATDIFVRDREQGTTELISVPHAYNRKTPSWGAALSGDARQVAFTSSSRVLRPEGPVPEAVNNVYLYDRDSRRMRLVSAAADGTPADGASGDVSLSRDGRYVAFTSAATNLAPGDDGDSSADVFLKDMETGEVRLVSRESEPVSEDTRPGRRTGVSEDGTAVVFDSPAGNLVPDDTNGAADVFLRHVR
ncbi:TolB family protein [Streptomyces alfalfae]|uniref:TolB family protein n=1 Tax=Streptomyces alfalfae TaxID=1642299 RepID=UPI0009A1E164|nr:PD40 domain-containing protein [Streptomyces alfalfae]QUI35543.1 PD40 domain-containing protein [Streptomyces alfalfae]